MHKRLRLVVLLTRAGLAVERALKAFWPLGSILLFVLSAIAFGLHDILPLAVLFAAGALVIAALAVAAVLGFRRFSMPLGLDAVRWLDETATGAPLEALSDMPALGKSDPASIALWRLHQNRMAEAARSLRPRAPSLQLAGLDPYGIRLIALWAVSLAIIFGAPARVLTLAEIMPGEGQSVIAQGPLWEGWVQPPSYTGKPGLYLADQSAQTFAVPAGSMVTIRLYGSPGKVAVHHDLGDELVENVEAPVQKFEVMRSGQLKIEGPGGRSWDLAVIPDAPPEVALLGWPERGLSGEFTLRYAASDDYGVEKGEVAVSLALEQVKRVHGLSVEPEALPPVVGNLSLPVGGNLQDFQGEYRENLEKHPWAGLPVTLKASVVDAAGQTGTSQSKAITLPSRRFFDPLARALIEQRRDLLWSAENSLRVSQVLRAVIHRPEEFFDAQANYLTLSVAISRLEGGTLSDDPEIRDEVAEALWAIAIGIEDGNIADARARLEQAQKRLQQAMESGATEEELAELMQELRDAMKDFLQELAQQESQDNRRFSENSNVQELTQEQLDSLLSQLQELMEQGRMAEAEQLLDMLREMMENMEMAGQPNAGGQQSPGQQAMESLSDMLRQQQGLNDDTFQGLQDRFGSTDDPSQQPSPQGQPGAEGSQQGLGPGQSFADRQNALRNELSELLDRLPGSGSSLGDEARDTLERSGRAMDEAERSLRDEDLAGALDDQSRALETLREGARDLAEQLSQQQGQGEQGEAFGRGSEAERRDPLGRQTGSDGKPYSDERVLGEDAPFQRAEDLIEELRRRSSEKARPQFELDYLKRLLERF